MAALLPHLIVTKKGINLPRVTDQQFGAFAELVFSDMRIELRRGDRTVAEKFLDLPDIVSSTDEIKPDRMTESMRGISPFQAGKPDPLLKIMLDATRSDASVFS